METRGRRRGDQNSDQGGKRLKITQNSGKNDKDNEITFINPLLNHLVLEKVFSYSQRIDRNFKDYRLVCKMWDNEVQKITRSFTQINLERILSPYPDGLGWTSDGPQNLLAYQAPYPIENVEVTGTCANLVDPQLRRWFELEGGNVKSLRFTSTLTCYHHVRFLECILKQWCPNLTSLVLAGVYSSPCVLFSSHFVDPNKTICVNLKQVIISVNEKPWDGPFRSCNKDLTHSYLKFDRMTFVDNAPVMGQRIHLEQCISVMAVMLPDTFIRSIIDEIPDLSRVYFDDAAHIIPPVSDLHRFQRYLSKQLVEYDGGILGQLLKSAPAVDSLQFRNMTPWEQFEGLVTLLHCQPNTLKRTLTSLHLENLSMEEGDKVDFFRVFGMQRYPLKELRIGFQQLSVSDAELYCFLRSFSVTLEHLEFTGVASNPPQKIILLNIPLLPKLKYFENQDVLCCQQTGFDFLLKSMPNLERCKLLAKDTLTAHEILVTNNMFENSYFQGEVHPLKEISMNLSISKIKHIKMLADWFPCLRKVELVLTGGQIFNKFFHVSANSLELEDVKISFMTSCRESGDMLINVGIASNLRKHESLQFLELEHLKDWPITMFKDALERGFTQAPKLTSVKLTNFSLQKIRTELDGIRFHLSSN